MGGGIFRDGVRADIRFGRRRERRDRLRDDEAPVAPDRAEHLHPQLGRKRRHSLSHIAPRNPHHLPTSTSSGTSAATCATSYP